MKVTILTYGSQGDVEPFIALSQGFLRAGHEVCLAGPELYRHLAAADEIKFIGFPGDPQGLVQEMVDGAGQSRWGMIRTMSRFVLPLAESVSEKARAAALDADVIIHSFLLTSTGFELAQEFGIPDISAQLFPVFSITSEFPAPAFPDLPLGPIYRRLTHRLVIGILRQGGRFLYTRVRRQHPHLPPLTGWPFDPGQPRQTPILYGFSPRVVPRPRDWPEGRHITGYWFASETGGWHPDKSLLDFINAGPPPVAIAFGSTATKDFGIILEKVLKALILSDQRGIIVGARGKVKDLPPGVVQTGYTPYDWLFPRSAAVIHHGGAGTTGKGLRAGVPSIILPFTSDQPFWGSQVCALGAGPKPIPPRNLSVERLANAVSSTLNDESLKKRAALIGQGIRDEDGVSQAVRIVESYCEGSARNLSG